MALLLVVIDGLGDLPPSPLEKARTPIMDRLAKEGITGMMAPVGRFRVPGSDVSHLQILGYDPEVYYPGRGPLEALGAGIALKEGDVAFRGNFATLKKGVIVDRRAGRVESKKAKKLAALLPSKIEDVEVIVKHTVEHRLAVVFRGKGLSAHVTETDPHARAPPLKARPTAPNAKKTASVINKFSSLSHKVLSSAPLNRSLSLPANYVLLRGSGVYRKVPSLKERFGLSACCIAGGALYKGVAKFVGMDVLNVKGATGDFNTDVDGKFKKAAAALKKYDLVFVHVKACDSAGHDGDFEKKKKMLERIDRALKHALPYASSIILTGDHSTPVALKRHSGHEVPLLVWGGERVDGVRRFSEQECMRGGLGHLHGRDIMPLVLNLLGKAKKYGS